MTADKAAAWLADVLDYQFSDPDLLRRALTHRSAGGTNNERLEFLGDAVLQVVVTERLFHERPDAREGRLSRLRSRLVKDTTLSEVAIELAVGEHLVLGPGERKSGGNRRASILADAVEALFGAVYLDAGFDVAKQVIYRAYGERIQNLPVGEELRDPKTRLQEYLQARQVELPAYELEQVTGKAHRQHFYVSCAIPALSLLTSGDGSSRRDAEQAAAEAMLAAIGSDAD